MLTFLARRLALAVPTLVGVLVVVFLLLYVAPGDPVQEMVGERADRGLEAALGEHGGLALWHVHGRPARLR